jgi:hypothetical protein
VDALDAFDAPPSEDLEDGADDEPDSEGEPSLCHTNDVDQTRAARHLAHDMRGLGLDDLEQEHDGREPDDDREDIDEREPEDFV